MTFNITVPNAAQSPGDFPPQNNANFKRLQKIINAEHNFTNTEADSEGIHKQCTFINRGLPTALPAGNGILYAKADATGTSQLNWYNGSTNQQLTPGVLVVSSSASVNASAEEFIFKDPGYNYVAKVFVLSSPLKTNGTNAILFGSTGNTVPTALAGFIPIFYSAKDLKIKNNDTTTQTIYWTLEVIRLQ